MIYVTFHLGKKPVYTHTIDSQKKYGLGKYNLYETKITHNHYNRINLYGKYNNQKYLINY